MESIYIISPFIEIYQRNHNILLITDLFNLIIIYIKYTTYFRYNILSTSILSIQNIYLCFFLF